MAREYPTGARLALIQDCSFLETCIRNDADMESVLVRAGLVRRMIEAVRRLEDYHYSGRLTKPFEVGQVVKTQGGDTVTVLEVKHEHREYACVRCSDVSENAPDGVWRYNRESDRGRVTGSAFDMSDPRNLVVELDVYEGCPGHPDYQPPEWEKKEEAA